MTALTQDAIREGRGDGTLEEVAIATSSKIYVGSLCAVRLTTGRAVAGTAATGRRVLGVCTGFAGAVTQASDGKGGQTGNASGTVRAVLEYDREFEFDVQAALRTNTNIGLNVFIGDDNLVSGTAVGSAGTRIPVGILTKFTNTAKSKAYVKVRSFAPSNVAT